MAKIAGCVNSLDWAEYRAWNSLNAAHFQGKMHFLGKGIQEINFLSS
jgi:hypothetical protein